VALRDEPAALRTRQAVEAWYRDTLRDRPALLFQVPPNHATSGALRFPVRLDLAVGRILAPYGVARSYPRTLDAYAPIRAAMASAAPPLPGARALAACVHTLPTHHLLSPAVREHLVRDLRRALDTPEGAR
jgi:dTDP-4-amino-4,6-dideoxygalactose transaminase